MPLAPTVLVPTLKQKQAQLRGSLYAACLYCVRCRQELCYLHSFVVAVVSSHVVFVALCMVSDKRVVQCSYTCILRTPPLSFYSGMGTISLPPPSLPA